MNDEIIRIFSLFFDDVPVSTRLIDTSRGDTDFRLTFIVQTDTGSKYVLKLADNDFTFPEKIAVWQRTVEEYRKLGYWCPTIFGDKSGGFPIVGFHGHKCTAYVEEYAPFRSGYFTRNVSRNPASRSIPNMERSSSEKPAFPRFGPGFLRSIS